MEYISFYFDLMVLLRTGQHQLIIKQFLKGKSLLKMRVLCYILTKVDLL